MEKDSAYYFALATSLSVVCPLLMWAFNWSKKADMKVISGLPTLLVVAGSVDAASFLLMSNRFESSLLLNSFFLLQFFLLCRVYYHFYLSEYPRFFLISIVAFIGFSILNTLVGQPITSFQNLTWTFSGGILILFSIGWKLHAIVTLPAKQINLYGPFWINTAILFYFTVNLFLFVMTNYVFTKMDNETGKIFWAFHNFNNLIKNILFAIGIYFFNKKFEDNKLEAAAVT